MSEETELEQDRVTVVRDGLAFPWWTSVEIVESIDNCVSTFALEIAGVYATAAAALREDQDVRVYVGEELVITGVIDDVSIGGDANGVTVKVTGRSSTREVVDCSAPLQTPGGLKLIGLVRRLLTDYPIEVVDEAGVGDQVVRAFHVDEGETLFDALDRLSRDHAFLVTDDARGRLVLTRAGAGGAAGDTIARGAAGFLSGDVMRSCAERYSHYQVRGQQLSDLDVDVDVQGGADDIALKRFRQLIIRPERGLSREAADLRARWEATTRAAKALQASYALRGWRKANGALWRKNEVVPVLDGLCGVIGAELLAVSVRRTLNATEGRVTSIELAPPLAYTPQPTKVDAKAYAYEIPESTDPDALGPDDLGGYGEDE